MEIGTIVVALVLIFIAWKVVTGIIKFGLIAAVVLGAGYLLYSQGALS